MNFILHPFEEQRINSLCKEHELPSVKNKTCKVLACTCPNMLMFVKCFPLEDFFNQWSVVDQLIFSTDKLSKKPTASRRKFDQSLLFTSLVANPRVVLVTLL